TFGPFCAPPALLVKQVESGQLWDLSGAVDQSKFGAIVDRLMGATFLPAAQLVDEGVGSLADIDIGARVGLRWKEGPFGHMNRMGPKRAAELIGAVAKRWNLSLPKVIAEHAATNTLFPFCFVRSEIRNGIATLTFNRPDTLNAVNEEVVRQMKVAVDAAIANRNVTGIVLAGAGKAFVAGADIGVFIRNIETHKIPDTIAFTKRGHELLHAIDTSPKPVVARLHGLALGGGFEIALACDYIVASDKASMAFPETGIGIYPGLGGTQRTSRRVGVGLAKYLVFTGQMIGAADAAEMGLIDKAVPQAALDATVAEFLAKGPVTTRTPKEPPAKYRAVAERFAHASADDLRTADPAAESDEQCRKAIGKLAGKGPIALRLAGKIIEQGAEVPLEQGLALELEFLSQIFATHDALAGLKSIGGAPPVFEDR
ncbi:MAG: enoyl-CoA hydratase/isomerase family protein, partial [Gammaproteobacteria bacterium]|nr:enoyl-CoA hydratase/isomerase family protein [Gammaproteobacteria bacterium]